MSEDRGIPVKAETRTTVAKSEKRSVSATAGERTVRATAETRSIKVGKSGHTPPGHAITRNLIAGLYNDDDMFFPAIVDRFGDLVLAASLYEDDDIFYEPLLEAGSVDIAPDLYENEDAFFFQSLALGDDSVDLQPSLYADADSFYTSTVTTGAVGLTPSLYIDPDVFYAPAIAVDRNLAPSLFVDADTFYSPRISDFVVRPSLFADGDVFYSPTVSTGTPSLLAKLDWEGGSSYYAQFANANAAGWSSPSFFPIGVWLSPTQAPYPTRLATAGVNFYMQVEHNLPLTNVTSAGISVMPQIEEWTTGEVGSNTLAVSWQVADEPEMNESFGNDAQRLATVQSRVATANARNDGRFTSANFGNGVDQTFWGVGLMDDYITAVDFASVDQYAYTSGSVRFNITTSGDWPVGVNAQCSAAYGWLADQMRSFQTPGNRKPFAVFVETARPLVEGFDPSTITMPQLEGAMWAAIIHEARGIMFFQHNNDPAIAFYSLADNATINAAVAGYTAKIRSVAPVLNTQTSVWDYGSADIYTMTKVYGGDLYIFACLALGGTVAGTKTFTLPAGITGTTVTVLDESRTRIVTAGAFTDTFAAEYTHHVYRVTI